jgi:hypothetical protein
MSYWNIKNSIGNNSRIHDSGFKSNTDVSGNSSFSEFYEIEEAVVLDVIYDSNHPEIKNLISDSWPDNYKDEPAKSEDLNYTYIGRVKFRLLNSQVGVPKEKLSWAKPLYSTGIIEYPLLNEIVLIAKYRSEWYYIKKLNINGFINNNANFNVEKTEGNTGGNRADDFSNKNKNLPIVNPTDKSSPPISYTGPKNVKAANNKGILGYYFLANNKIRTLKKYEGDLTIESRHGQSIRFSSYDNERKNDIGDSKNPDYKGCGNPMILIRNKQRPLGDEKKDRQLHPLLNPIQKITDIEKNVGGLIEEDINNDGSSIQITSGLTETKWKTTVYKSIFSLTFQEEQIKYSPIGATSFKYPVLNGDQIVIQTDRLILSTRFGEFFNYSKKRYSVITDSEYTVDADDQIVITSNTKTVINSPAIYLGEYDNTNEPAILGQTAVNWLYDLCEWIKNHTHWYDHSHPDAGGAEPNKTQKPVELIALENLQNSLHKLLSRRVFLTGGGFSPGADGISPKNTDSIALPTKIDIISGKGVPGGFFGANRRK